MRGHLVECGLCGTTVKLGKGGRLPEHLTNGYRPRRCNGVSRGLRIAMAAASQPWRRHWPAIERRWAFRNASQALVHDPGVQYLVTREQRHAAYKGWARNAWTIMPRRRRREQTTEDHA